jgi:hypothetical protein
MTLKHTWGRPVPGPAREIRADLSVRLPFNQATAVIENITAHEHLVSVRLYGHPWAM